MLSPGLPRCAAALAAALNHDGRRTHGVLVASCGGGVQLEWTRRRAGRPTRPGSRWLILEAEPEVAHHQWRGGWLAPSSSRLGAFGIPAAGIARLGADSDLRLSRAVAGPFKLRGAQCRIPLLAFTACALLQVHRGRALPVATAVEQARGDSDSDSSSPPGLESES